MTLNISTEQSIPGEATPTADAGGAPEPAPTAERRALNAEVIAELSSWNPREFIGAFRRWHQGSLSLIHLNVLTLLEVEGPLSMSKLAEALDVSVASATGIVDRMEERGLVERVRVPDDRRVVLVRIGERGRQALEETEAVKQDRLQAILGHLDKTQLDCVATALEDIRGAVVEEFGPDYLVGHDHLHPQTPGRD